MYWKFWTWKLIHKANFIFDIIFEKKIIFCVGYKGEYACREMQNSQGYGLPIFTKHTAMKK